MCCPGRLLPQRFPWGSYWILQGLPSADWSQSPAAGLSLTEYPDYWSAFHHKQLPASLHCLRRHPILRLYLSHGSILPWDGWCRRESVLCRFPLPSVPYISETPRKVPLWNPFRQRAGRYSGRWNKRYTVCSSYVACQGICLFPDQMSVPETLLLSSDTSLGKAGLLRSPSDACIYSGWRYPL